MAATKWPRFPFVLSANALLSGSVIYHSQSGWSPQLGEASVAHDEDSGRALERAHEQAQFDGEVVEPELVPVRLDDADRPIPIHYRGRIRALGPTVRSDLGPQAQGLHDHVSV
jgi:hypothetical protein